MGRDGGSSFAPRPSDHGGSIVDEGQDECQRGICCYQFELQLPVPLALCLAIGRSGQASCPGGMQLERREFIARAAASRPHLLQDASVDQVTDVAQRGVG